MKPGQKKQTATEENKAKAVTQIETKPRLPHVGAGIECQPCALHGNAHGIVGGSERTRLRDVAKRKHSMQSAEYKKDGAADG